MKELIEQYEMDLLNIRIRIRNLTDELKICKIAKKGELTNRINNLKTAEWDLKIMINDMMR